MQPVQLSLVPEGAPLPPADLAGSLAPRLLDAATELLGRLIAKACDATTEEGGDE